MECWGSPGRQWAGSRGPQAPGECTGEVLAGDKRKSVDSCHAHRPTVRSACVCLQLYTAGRAGQGAVTRDVKPALHRPPGHQPATRPAQRSLCRAGVALWTVVSQGVASFTDSSSTRGGQPEAQEDRTEGEDGTLGSLML